MTQSELPEENASASDNRRDRRVYFVRLDKPQAGQGPHWIGTPVSGVSPSEGMGSGSVFEPESPVGRAASGQETEEPRPYTRIDQPLPLAATARPAPHTPRAPFSDEPLQNQARQLVVHLRARHRDLRRRQRELQRQTANQVASVAAHEWDESSHDTARASEIETTVPVAAELVTPQTTPVSVPAAANQAPNLDLLALERRLATREEELDAFAARLRRREEELDLERSALDQMRTEVNARNQEAMEMRLACEQLWSQLASRMEVPRLVESIAQLRRKIADQYQGAAAELAQQRDEARQLIYRLDDRQKQLRKQREEIQAWVMRRHEELEVQYIELLKRQQELDARERAQQQLQAQVQDQILEYQRKIRQLTAQLRCKQELSRLPT